MVWVKQGNHWHWHDFANEKARCGATPQFWPVWSSETAMCLVSRYACGMCRQRLTNAERAVALMTADEREAVQP